MPTRSDLLVYLEARLNIAEWYKRHPEIDQEVIKEPVFIVGFGRSGTTILHEVLSQDPQFRSVRARAGLSALPELLQRAQRAVKVMDGVSRMLDVNPLDRNNAGMATLRDRTAG